MFKAETLHRLEARQEQLAELFLRESDTATWPSLDTKEGRGDRYWLKKNAAQTIALAVRIQTILDRALTPIGTSPDAPTPGDPVDEELEREIAVTEQQAADLIAKVRKRRDGKAPG